MRSDGRCMRTAGSERASSDAIPEDPDRRRGGGAHPRRRHRHRILLLRARLPGRGARGDRRAFRRSTAIRATSPRSIRSPPATCGASRASTISPRPGCLARILGGSYPSGPSSARAAGDLEDGHRQRDPGLQHPLRHPVRHASRGGGEAAGRADQGRHGHLRRSASARAAR